MVALDEIHSYENFLATHDPELRRSLGVFYTPQPAVSYIVRAVDDILRQDFKLRDGLADTAKVVLDGREFHRVQILDPATGVGTFLFEVIKQIHQRIKNKYGLDVWRRYVPEHLLPRLHGFEVMETPYKIAHVKLAECLQDTGYQIGELQRFNIHLTNALEPQEQYEQLPIMVALGNPPYNVSTMNKSPFANELIVKYKTGEGVENERNIQPLSDDYIKFMALGQHFIETNPAQYGILAYISNNSFLNGVIHRQMRKSLLETFDKIYILNLHGSARRKETAPDGGKDKNVFNIMQGNSINIFIKKPSTDRKTDKHKLAKVFYADLYGKRQDKYDFLSSKKLKRTGYSPLKLSAPYYFFVPKDFSLQREYEKGFSVVDLFPTYSSGVQTKRDALFIDNDKETLIVRMQTLLSGNYDWRFEDKYRVSDTSGYEITQRLKGKKFNRQFVRQIEYRPFDRKWIYYDPDLLARAFYSTMQHIPKAGNIMLLTCRQQSTFSFQHVFITSLIADCCSVSSQGSEWTYIFPLYVYPPLEERRPNFNQEIVAKIEHIIGKKVKPEKLFDYIYAVLHSPKYRKDYEEFLKIDFPKIPYPVDNTEFERLAKYGQRLRELHLFEKIPKMKTTFPMADGNVVENVRFVDGKVYINKTQYFGNVPVSAWEFYIGGYQPLQKYLKDHKGRVLTFEEIQHYQKIAAVLGETETIMRELDS